MASSESFLSIVLDPARLAALDGYGVLDTPEEERFEDAVRLAARLCATPVALVSLVASDRQWFKARVGFPACETDLDRSVCKFALAEPDLLIIPDLTADPRTAHNPLVTDDPHIRFYAGAPLRTPEGQVLGSLCVIDTVPRAGGLTPEQADDLRALGRHVSDQLAMRRALTNRDQALLQQREAQRALKASEAYWRDLFQRLNEGFVVGELVRDAYGTVVDWRYIDVNSAWGKLVGVDPATAVGRTIREVLPEIEDAWINDFAEVVHTGKPITFVRQVGALQRWYEGRAFSLGSDRFGVIFLEITDRVVAEARRNALLQLGDRLRDLETPKALTMAACETLGETLDVMLVGYGAVDPRAETITVEQDWTARGAATLAGTLNFRDFGSYIEDLKNGDTVIVRDCRDDPRTREHASALEARSARAFVNTPVFERGLFVGLLYVSTAEPRDWRDDELAFIRDVASRLRLSLTRAQAEEGRELVNQEMAHRLKNTLAMVISIAGQTLRGVSDREKVEAFEQRIHTLSQAHDVLVKQNWTAASAKQVVEAVVAKAGHGDRIEVSGPDLALGPRATMSLSLLIHEMATNAAKYGAFSASGGRVRVDWRLEDDEVILNWIESGGPPPTPPPANTKQVGFGSRLIRMGLTGSGGVDLRYPPSGFEATMRAPLVQLQWS